MAELGSKFWNLGIYARIQHDNLYIKMPKEKIHEEKLRVGRPGESEEDVKSRLDGACASFMEDIFAAVNWSELYPDW